MPGWLGWLGCVVMGTLLVLIMSRDTRNLSQRVRYTLIGLRLSVLLLLLVLMGRPLLSVNRTIDPLIVLLIDTSESMSLKDEYPAGSMQNEIDRLLQVDSLPTRLNLSRGLLLADDQRFLKTLRKSHKLRV